LNTKSRSIQRRRGDRRSGRSLPVVLCVVGAAIVLALGFNNGDKLLPSRQVAEETSIDARPAPLPVPTPTRVQPTPTPTPDPQAIPQWAQGRVINEVPVRPQDKVIALTFDDGPWPDYTEQILNILAANDVKATFYMVGSVLKEYPRIGRAVRDGGHAIGNHSWSHAMRPRDPAGEIARTDAAIKSILGVTSTTFRPPYGELRNGMARAAMKRKHAVLMWSADSNDWKGGRASRLVSTVVGQASRGGVALMHDGGGNRSQTVAAVPRIIRELRERGYRFVTVPELLKLRYIAPRQPKKPAKGKHKVKARAAPAHNAKPNKAKPA